MSREALQGRLALVTGAGRRIGKAIALALADRGVNLILHYRSSRRPAEELAASLRERGVQARTVQGELSDPRQVDLTWKRAGRLAAGEPISILINNASIFPSDTLDSLTEQDLEASFGVNAWAPLRLSRLFFAQGRCGCIVNLLDSRLHGRMKKHLAYSLSKRALFSLTRLTALEYAPAVRVNAVAPGMILPPAEGGREELAALVARAPLARWGDAEDVARAVLFLVENDFVTGQVLYVDGGSNLREGLYG